MWERRPMFGALIGLTLCLSLWSLAMQESTLINDISTSSTSTAPVLNVVYTQQQQLQNSTQKIANRNYRHIAHYNTNSKQSLNDLAFESYDYHRLIDLVNFTFLINQKSCHDLDLDPIVLILIHTAPLNLNKRNVIRETWGHKDLRARLLFFIGDVDSSALQTSLENENKIYGDLVQGNFIDAYRNMTYKHVAALKWFAYNCPRAKYILKTDDDVFVNMPILYEFLENNIARKKFIYCFKVIGSRVKRTYRSKWRVSGKEYPNKYYPHYCAGYSIIYSPDTAYQLYNEAQQTPYFWIDDVHITGTLAKKINTRITSDRLYLDMGDMNKMLNGKLNGSTTPFLFTSPNLQESQIRGLYKAVYGDSERLDYTVTTNSK